jgi:hypothetical protein
VFKVEQCWNYRVTGFELVEMKTGNTDNGRKGKRGDERSNLNEENKQEEDRGNETGAET